MAAVDSMCELSLRSGEFATRAVEFLVDMFNDEIDAVRYSFSLVSINKLSY